MNKKWLTTALSVMIGLSLMLNIAFATGVAKVELDVVPFRWVVGGKAFSSTAPYFDGEVDLPSSLNYKGTTYVPLRLAAQSLGYRVQWNDSSKTAVISLENEDDPVADQVDSSGNYPNYKFIPAQVEVPLWEQRANSSIILGLKYMGTPYDFGAALGQTDTFDCSSFTNFVFKENGIKLPRNSRQQSELGSEVRMDQIRKGDLLFFTTPKRKDKTGIERIGHVSIYIGDNKMLHTYRVGIGVVVSELDERWRNRFITAKRIINE
ncbi:MAG: hypothetical protein K0Q81_459 [Paenibacillus sp.]|nr:hypothetical protein [Paenibacillus sp.]